MPSVPLHFAIHATGYAALIVRLLTSGLVRKYPFFSTYVLFELLRSLAVYVIRPGTTAYGDMYFTTQPIAWLLNALVVLEVFQSALVSHPGIATLGKHAVSLALIVAAAVSIGTLFVSGIPHSPFEILERYLLIERVIYSSLLVFLLILLAFLAYYPVPLSRNALVHASILSIYFVTRVTLWITRNLTGPQFTQTMNLTMAVVVGLAILAWTVCLSRAGEAQRVRSSRRANKDEEERLIAQLERINATLLRSGRK